MPTLKDWLLPGLLFALFLALAPGVRAQQPQQPAPLAGFVCDQQGVCQTSEAEVDRIQAALRWLQQELIRALRENEKLKKMECT